MSLVHLGVHGDKNNCVSKGAGWSNADVALLHSEAGLAKIHRQFDVTPFKFNINIHLGTYLVHAEGDRLRGDVIRPDELIRPDCVNLCHTTNVTGPNAMPMNAWTMVHRMAHAIQAGGQVSEYNLISEIGEGYKHMTGEEPKLERGRINGFGKHPNALLIMLCTMRSARMGMLENDLDFLGELLAQYVITGKIKLLRVEDWGQRIDMLHSTLGEKAKHSIWWREEVYGCVEHFFMKAQEHCTPEKLNEEIAKLERGIGFELHRMLESAVGKLLSF
jgi:hypothetical protein